jgi:hypothetical protein
MIIPYDHDNQKMQRFVFTSFALGAGGPDQANLLRHFLRDGARILVNAIDGDPDIWKGWACAYKGVVIWAYTKTELMLAGGTVTARGRGVCKELLTALGFTKDKPVPVRYDTPAARRFRSRGWDVKVERPEPPEAA